ncbi:MAG: hypothetical protein AAGF59_01825 [Pseudomonadota bacterium]
MAIKNLEGGKPCVGQVPASVNGDLADGAVARRPYRGLRWEQTLNQFVNKEIEPRFLLLLSISSEKFLR